MVSWEDEVVSKLVEVLRMSSGAGTEHEILTKKKRRSKAEETVLHRIASNLLATAIRNGLVVGNNSPKFKPLRGGNTALQVSIASMQVDFVFKADSSNKLIREARTLQEMRSDVRLQGFRSRLPKVYAIHDQEPPYYAYLMEYFDGKVYPSIKQIFFGRENPPSPDDAVQIVASALDALREGYVCSKDDRQQVRLMGEAYYRRIKHNLAQAAKMCDDFRPVSVDINGRLLRSWEEYLKVLRNRESVLQGLAPPFVTVVHGDPNPGNILVRRDGGRIEDVKFIDVKDWKYGDYLFDIAKLSHFLLHTGPVEELEAFDIEPIERTPECLRFRYSVKIADYIKGAVDKIETKAQEIAEELGDPHWALRYKLAMGSNVLGLIPGRLKEGRSKESRILYAEGMKYLDDFIQQFELIP